jgi:hypothetical protein
MMWTFLFFLFLQAIEMELEQMELQVLTVKL